MSSMTPAADRAATCAVRRRAVDGVTSLNHARTAARAYPYTAPTSPAVPTSAATPKRSCTVGAGAGPAFAATSRSRWSCASQVASSCWIWRCCSALEVSLWLMPADCHSVRDSATGDAPNILSEYSRARAASASKPSVSMAIRTSSRLASSPTSVRVGSAPVRRASSSVITGCLSAWSRWACHRCARPSMPAGAAGELKSLVIIQAKMPASSCLPRGLPAALAAMRHALVRNSSCCSLGTDLYTCRICQTLSTAPLSQRAVTKASWSAGKESRAMEVGAM
mmetsp:Transcript_23240/g.78090  ORF Transcript_23240/g.78090 Transcript_23240/m.78090 type:complete len:280 (-) Transcript_23240:426-1265(-)